MLAPWKKGYDKPRQHINKQRYYSARKDLFSQRYGFSSSHVWVWDLDYKENWRPKNWCFWTAVLEKTLESSLDCKGNQSILKEISPEYSSEGLMLKLKLQYFGHLMQEVTHWKRPWCWKHWRWEKKGLTENKMIGWHHRLDGHEFEETAGVDEGQGSLVCCSPWGHKELNMIERLNWTEN